MYQEDDDQDDFLYATLETVKDTLSRLLIDGEMHTTDEVGVALAMVVQLEQKLAMGFEDEDPVHPTVAILSKRLVAKPLEFEGIDPAVLEAVYSACDSAENNKLEEWESDLIITRIVEKHSGARKLAHNTEQ